MTISEADWQFIAEEWWAGRAQPGATLTLPSGRVVDMDQEGPAREPGGQMVIRCRVRPESVFVTMTIGEAGHDRA